MPNTYTGTCLCKKVKLTLTNAENKMGACHCHMCRKWGSGPFLTMEATPENFTIQGEENITYYDSSEWAQRAFCTSCGSNLFYALKDKSAFYVSSELFEEKDLEFSLQIFMEEKPNYYSFANETHCMTGAEVFSAATEHQK